MTDLACVYSQICHIMSLALTLSPNVGQPKLVDRDMVRTKPITGSVLSK